MNEEHEQALIREAIDKWMRATAAGDVESILGLMANDVVYLTCGHPPMRGKEVFAAQLRAALQKIRINGTSAIQEIQVAGNQAFCWSHLSIEFTSIKDGSRQRREGDVLSVFKKENGRWVLYRDANLMPTG
jgi:uncharacterized protein (TIGR02246 family)